MQIGKFSIGLLELSLIAGVIIILWSSAIKNGAFSSSENNYHIQEESCRLLSRDAVYANQIDVCLVPDGDGLWKEYNLGE